MTNWITQAREAHQGIGKTTEVDSMNRLRVQAEDKARLYRRALLLACNGEEDQVAYFVSEAATAISEERAAIGVQAPITAEMVRQLSSESDRSLMDCKRALVEASGDVAAAKHALRLNNLASASGVGGTVADVAVPSTERQLLDSVLEEGTQYQHRERWKTTTGEGWTTWEFCTFRQAVKASRRADAEFRIVRPDGVVVSPGGEQ